MIRALTLRNVQRAYVRSYRLARQLEVINLFEKRRQVFYFHSQ